MSRSNVGSYTCIWISSSAFISASCCSQKFVLYKHRPKFYVYIVKVYSCSVLTVFVFACTCTVYIVHQLISSCTSVFLMLLQIGQTYWWKGLNKDVNEYCRRCDVCQRVNAKLEGKKPELHPIPVPSQVWSQIGIDLIGMYI